MYRTRRLPLSLRLLKASPVKTFAATAGICFANVLVFFEMGLLNAIYQSQERPYSLLDGDIVLASNLFTRLSQAPGILKSDVMRAQGLEGIEKVSALSITSGTVLVLPNGYTTSAQVYAIDPLNSALNPVRAKLDLDAISLYERAAIDRLSSPLYVKNVTGILVKNQDYQTNLGNGRLFINSTASIGSTFAADYSLVMSNDNLTNYFPDHNPGLVSIGVAKIKKGYSTQRVLKGLIDLYPKGYSIQVYTVPQIAAIESDYWRKHTTLSFIFGLGVLVGFVVSGVILYQILYSDVVSHIGEYATLLALGYTKAFIARTVFSQAILLTLMAFPFAIGISVTLYAVLSTTTNLLIYMTASRAATVLILGSLTSFLSGYLATGQLRKADPSTLY